MNTQTLERPALVETPVAPKSNLAVFTPARGEAAGIYPRTIAKAITAIRREINPVAKDGKVEFGQVKYRYPKSDDVLDEVLPLLAHHGLNIVQSEVKQVLFETERMLAITYQFTVFNEDAEVWPERPERTGLAWVRSSRGEIDDKASNKASTQAEKWFYIKFFGIRTSDAAQLDNDAIVPDAEQTAKPKPPKPGSAEAAALDGPRAVPTNGLAAADWVTGFIKEMETSADAAEVNQWLAANKNTLDKLEAAQFKAENLRITEAIDARIKALSPKPPKPPKPEATEQKPAAPAVPDVTADPKGWITWLGEKMNGFDTYETGETYWNERVQALDLSFDVQEDAMGIWRNFERRFES